ncbi:hypothetical protein MAE02_51050 [Microvirga aerophila]|uniref:Uncharacterized protein n=1 Tax=Microvirga aerophila TaxID=670291 RepID=A0A512BZM1_9HYPH|nr:hypothetical protein MAE02_51050 [Microvirga aerophila]
MEISRGAAHHRAGSMNSLLTVEDAGSEDVNCILGNLPVPQRVLWVGRLRRRIAIEAECIEWIERRQILVA